MQAVGQGKIDQPVFTPERNGRLGAIFRQWLQMLADSAGEYNGQDIL
jgi:hypothetical protein